MTDQEKYNREVLLLARHLVATAGLDKLPLTQALGQITHGFSRRGAVAVQQFIDTAE